MDSILDSIKQMCGIDPSNKDFDVDLIIFINAAFSTLAEIGVVPNEGYKITTSSDMWDDILGDTSNLEDVKEYIYLRVRLVFNPPSTSFAVQEFQKRLEELAWRINVKGGDVDES